MLCRHCQRRKANRPRGLCWSCYYSPGVREFYLAVSKYGMRGICNGFFTAKPTTPTSCQPGSEQKIAVMCRRAELGEEIHHELDPRQRPAREFPEGIPVRKCWVSRDVMAELSRMASSDFLLIDEGAS